MTGIDDAFYELRNINILFSTRPRPHPATTLLAVKKTYVLPAGQTLQTRIASEKNAYEA